MLLTSTKLLTNFERNNPCSIPIKEYSAILALSTHPLHNSEVDICCSDKVSCVRPLGTDNNCSSGSNIPTCCGLDTIQCTLVKIHPSSISPCNCIARDIRSTI